MCVLDGIHPDAKANLNLDVPGAIAQSLLVAEMNRQMRTRERERER